MEQQGLLMSHRMQDGIRRGPRPTINEFNVLSPDDSPEYVFELSLHNPGDHPVFVESLNIHSLLKKDVMHFMTPPTFTYNLTIDRVRITHKGFSGLFDRLTPDGKPWGDSVPGTYVDAPYSSLIELAFPIFLELPPSQKGVLRFVLSDKLSLDEKAPRHGAHLDALDADLDMILDRAPQVPCNLIRPEEKHQFHLLYGASALVISIDSGAPILGKLNFPFLFDRVSL
jgi:hypothetical protein